MFGAFNRAKYSCIPCDIALERVAQVCRRGSVGKRLTERFLFDLASFVTYHSRQWSHRRNRPNRWFHITECSVRSVAEVWAWFTKQKI